MLKQQLVKNILKFKAEAGKTFESLTQELVKKIKFNAAAGKNY